MPSFARELLGDRGPSVSPPCPQLHPLENGSSGTDPPLRCVDGEGWTRAAVALGILIYCFSFAKPAFSQWHSALSRAGELEA